MNTVRLIVVNIFRKFYITEKVKSGTVKETDYTKQNLYAACLQYHKEHKWAQDSSYKLLENISDENYVRFTGKLSTKLLSLIFTIF